jgi:hypothetical protein
VRFILDPEKQIPHPAKCAGFGMTKRTSQLQNLETFDAAVVDYFYGYAFVIA